MNFHQSLLSTEIKVARNLGTAAWYGHGYTYLHMQSWMYYAVICSTEFILSFQEHNTEPQLMLHIPAKYPSMPNCDAASHFHTTYKMGCGSSYNNLQGKINYNTKISISCMGSGAGRRPTSPKILEVLDNDEQLVPTFSLGEQKSPITKGWGVCFDSKLYLTNPLAYTVLKMGLHNLDHISQHRPTIRLVNDT